jgi:hypothetical protein
MKRRLAILAAIASGWIAAAICFWVLPTEDEWDGQYLEGFEDGEDSCAQRAGA